MGSFKYIGLKTHDLGFDAHLTLLYTGIMDEEQTQIANDILDTYGKQSYFVLRDRVDLFGPRNNTPVLRVVPPNLDLLDLRMTLIEKGVPNASSFNNWNPHITLDFEHSGPIHLPALIWLSDLGIH